LSAFINIYKRFMVVGSRSRYSAAPERFQEKFERIMTRANPAQFFILPENAPT
jgi:hypothetical protein